MPYPYSGNWSPQQSFRTAGMRRPGTNGLGTMNVPNDYMRQSQPQVMQQPSPVMNMGAGLQQGWQPNVMQAPMSQAPAGTGGFMPQPMMQQPNVMQQPMNNDRGGLASAPQLAPMPQQAQVADDPRRRMLQIMQQQGITPPMMNDRIMRG